MGGRTQRLARHLDGLLRPGDDGGDADLLGRFVAERDEAAFTVLVRRHGPMVFGVCRRVLRDAHAADDAFQATFLVLARRAGSLRRRSLLANWLYGVAFRTALEARRAGAVRRVKETRAAAMKEWTVEPGGEKPDLTEALDRELAALPEMYRAAIVLCDLEGVSRAEAASRLGWTEGTLSGRLARARALLVRRLAKYGLTAAGLAAATGVADGLPPVLVESTARAAVLTAVGHSVAGVVPAAAVELSQGVMKAMFVSKLKTMVAVAMVAGAVAWGGAAGQLSEASAGPQDQAGKAKKARDTEQDRIAQLERERDELRRQLADLRDRLQAMEQEHVKMREQELYARRQAEVALAAERDAREQEAKAQRDMRRFFDETPLRQSGAPSPESVPASRPSALPSPVPLGPLPTPQPAPAINQPRQAVPGMAPPSTHPQSLPPSNQPRQAVPGMPSPPSPSQPMSRGPFTAMTGQPVPMSNMIPPAEAVLILRVYNVEDLAADEKQAESIVRIINATVEPRSWQVLGGEGVVEYFATKKLLVVRQTPEVHHQLEELIQLLRPRPGQPTQPGRTR